MRFVHLSLRRPPLAALALAATLVFGLAGPMAPSAANAESAPAEGLVTKTSVHTVEATLDKLESILRDNGITVFARVDHAEGAAGVDLALRPTQVLIFGNPRLGAPLMQSARTVGIDLPMKALAWEDSDGQVHLAYNDPAYLARRHGISDRAGVLRKMSGALAKLTDAATR
jgi:uncharacterized protein (DUF302 family)